MNALIPLHDFDDWMANSPSTLRCTVLSILNLDGTHPTGIVLGLDFRPAWDHGLPPVYAVRLDGEEIVRHYQRKEIDF
jgi:hypothetical protein